MLRGARKELRSMMLRCYNRAYELGMAGASLQNSKKVYSLHSVHIA